MTMKAATIKEMPEEFVLGKSEIEIFEVSELELLKVFAYKPFHLQECQTCM